MKNLIGIKLFKQEGCLSYVLYDRDSKQAAVIDPLVDQLASYREFLIDHGLKLRFALDTHVHADHLSATHLLKAEMGCEIGMGSLTQSPRATLKLSHHQKVELGAFTIECLHTPGHTPDSVSYLLSGSSLPVSAVFTGDTLFIGNTGRTDFPGASPAALFESLNQVLGKLPDDTLVYPGHDYNNFIFSTIGVEKKKNEDWKILDKAQFVTKKQAEVVVTAESVSLSSTVKFNLALNPETASAGSCGGTQCGKATAMSGQIPSITVDKYSAKIKEHAQGQSFLDVREIDEYQEGHIPQVTNFPMAEVGFHLSELKKSQRVYVSCQAGMRSAMVARTLDYLGLPDVVNVTGGFKAWESAGLVVER